MDTKTISNRFVVSFDRETEIQRRQAQLAAGYLCVDASDVKVAEDGMTMTFPIIPGVAVDSFHGFIGQAMAHSAPPQVDQMPV